MRDGAAAGRRLAAASTDAIELIHDAAKRICSLDHRFWAEDEDRVIRVGRSGAKRGATEGSLPMISSFGEVNRLAGSLCG